MQSYQQPYPPAPVYQPPAPIQLPGPFEPAVTQQEEPVGLKTWLKITYIVGFVSLFLVIVFFASQKIIAQTRKRMLPEELLLETRYKPVLWRDFGEVFEPIIEIPLVYPDDKPKNEEFLLDSGAVVSSLPREMARPLGFSLAKLPRSTFAGFGNTTSFAYKADIGILLGPDKITIPVVFTEAAGTKAILGRAGFFETFSVYFNSKEKKIEIRK